MENGKVHDVVMSGYAEVARKGSGCCGTVTEQASSCCDAAAANPHADTAARIGYSEEDITGAAAEANLGLGCGNPTALASLKPGDVVVDLGSGAGFDALLSAQKLGPDPLIKDADPSQAITKVRKSSKSIGELLMDQTILAGVGNIYRCEVLFIEGMDLRRPGKEVWLALTNP